jgi:NurA domain-containing protein
VTDNAIAATSGLPSFPPCPAFVSYLVVSVAESEGGTLSLKFDEVAREIGAMSSHAAAWRVDVEARIARALEGWGSAADAPDRVAAKIGAARTSWLLARPAEPPGRYPLPEMEPSAWRALATDGSQIEVSRHEIAPCYLVNVGEVVLEYGARAGAKLASKPLLRYAPEDLYPIYGDEQRSADGAVVAAARDAAEYSRLAELVAGSPADVPSVGLVDGTLILWRDETNPRGLARLGADDLKRRRLDAMLSVFDAGERAGVPVVGYVSSPAGTDVINTLKVMACPEHPVDCDRCPFTPPGMRRTAVHDKPCDVVDRVTDAAMFRRLLAHGERSPLFWSSAPVLEAYGRHRVAFCYLHAGHEIARLEMPAYVAESRRLVDLAHWIVMDQAERGRGYPVALAEAHEQAVVRGADRYAFFALVARRFARDGHPIVLSRKELRKRGALV